MPVAIRPPGPPGFALGSASIQRLQGVHPDLVRVVQRAIQVTPLDFSVTEGLRSIDRQRELVAAGKSRTMQSRHLTGHAVDLVAIIDGKPSWQFDGYVRLAGAMKQAANEVNVPVRWGGCWLRINDVADLAQASKDYVARQKAAGKSALVDGPHFELPADSYPTVEV